MPQPIVHRTRPIGPQPFMGEKVDVIIPFHGQYHSVSKLIESIAKNTRTNSYKICIVDDASPNTSFSESLKQIPGITVVRNDKQQGFSNSCNLGFRSTTNPFVVFVHSDVTIQDPSWLLELGRSLIKDPKIGLVSARMDNPLDAEQLKSNRNDSGADKVIEEGSLPLICAMVRRSVFEKLGGLKPYPVAMYEDEELAYRMKAYGLVQVVSGRSWVHHEGGLTINALLKEKPELAQIMESNRDRCMADMVAVSQMIEEKQTARKKGLFFN